MSKKTNSNTKNSDLILYFYGAILGSAPVWLVMFVLFSTGIINNEDFTTITLFSSSLISGTIAAYFICRVTKSNEQSPILITGALSYLFTTIIFSIYGYSGGFTEEMAV